jgi:hypothetical protein
MAYNDCIRLIFIIFKILCDMMLVGFANTTNTTNIKQLDVLIIFAFDLLLHVSGNILHHLQAVSLNTYNFIEIFYFEPILLVNLQSLLIHMLLYKCKPFIKLKTYKISNR